mmetsp:Transcript_20606/g.29822  ORF Transcript_20606/g.29822 Transcript_20606/m.29822 type:complete len:245 (-) Transcript_20606:111-845(-)
MSAITGFLAGGLHALTGPDHLAALIPNCIGRPWSTSGMVGARWGLGHGLGAVMFGFLALMVKEYWDISGFSDFMEACVGVTLVVIGMNGLRTSASFANGHTNVLHYLAKDKKEDFDVERPPKSNPHKSASHHHHTHNDIHISSTATIMTGIIHGFTGTGHLVGVMPALTMPSLLKAAMYLGGFCLGTLIAMAGFTAVIGDLSLRVSSQLGSASKQNLLLLKFSVVSSSFAIVVGLLWIIKSFWH